MLSPRNKGVGFAVSAMARSSTTYSPKWKSGKTRVIRVPERIADELIVIAKALDVKRGQVNEPVETYELNAESPSVPAITERVVNVASIPQRSPFRYPGGKTWFVPILRAWMESHAKRPALFLEPFAGGASASLTVAFERLAQHVIFAETDDGVAAVWKTILNGQGEWLAREILAFDMTLHNVEQALALDANGSALAPRERAFLTILRNRVQRGGIMAPGAGLIKTGENNKGLASRWYPATLARRIREISLNLDRMSFYLGDGFALIDEYRADESAAFYIDPPYLKAARRLYRNWQLDHRKLFKKMATISGSFLMSYDNAEEIRALADEFRFEYRPVRMKNTHHSEMTELLIGRNLDWLRTSATSARRVLPKVSSQNRRGLSGVRP